MKENEESLGFACFWDKKEQFEDSRWTFGNRLILEITVRFINN